MGWQKNRREGSLFFSPVAPFTVAGRTGSAKQQMLRHSLAAARAACALIRNLLE